jgi:S1-C subfamily serine protease
MVVLAGGEHIAYGYGIPDRMKRRIPEANGARLLVDPEDNDRNRAAADYFLDTAKVNLPSAGRMGVVMDEDRHGVIARQITPEGAGAQAGMRTKDRIVSIDGQSIQTVADARLALLNKPPGQQVSIEVERGRWPGKKNRHLTLVLKN